MRLLFIKDFILRFFLASMLSLFIFSTLNSVYADKQGNQESIKTKEIESNYSVEELKNKTVKKVRSSLDNHSGNEDLNVLRTKIDMSLSEIFAMLHSPE